MTSLVAMVEERFARLPGSAGWKLELSFPLPVGWPARSYVRYAYGSRLRPGLADGIEVAAPWARLDASDPSIFEYLADRVSLLGIQGVHPMSRGELDLIAEINRAGTVDDLLARAPHDPSAAELVRRYYCNWSKQLIPAQLLRHHPEFATFLDCGNVQALREPAPKASPDVLLYSEFNKRWPNSPSRRWMPRLTPAFPMEWPASPRTNLCYYAHAICVDRSLPVPCPREVLAPWGVILRNGRGGSLAFFASQTEARSLGMQAGRSPPPDWLETRRALGEDEEYALLQATSDPVRGGAVRRFYREWMLDEPLLAPAIIARHPEFFAFVTNDG
ncbi:MAG TPA: hypothetical protein VFQ61_19425 [Polyangiaceae bacterium]|nr:hypothetical protein [Polyangiaceae bacterium]